MAASSCLPCSGSKCKTDDDDEEVSDRLVMVVGDKGAKASAPPPLGEDAVMAIKAAATARDRFIVMLSGCSVLHVDAARPLGMG